MKTAIKITAIVVFTLILYKASAQQQWVIKSVHLTRPDTVLVFKPADYDAKKAYPLTYLLHGYSENYSQWASMVDCQKLADQYQMIIVMPDGFVSWYVNSPYQKGSQMEDFFFKELVPKVHAAFKIDSRNIFISGLSMGGYGALRYFIQQQDYFNTAGSTSGGLIVDAEILQQASIHFFNNNRVTNDLTSILGNPGTNDWHQYSITNLLKSQKKEIKPFIIDCGTEDILYPSTLELKMVADSMKIPITYIKQPGNHDAAYWKQAILYHFVYFKSKMIN
ncbi:MAG: hypothetical protein J7623_00490 [Chitinophaga sp.]|uniref:alpha/beta hydrolase n=1 Tax=Chitinophaga sp. TaxID=1869181 RepID=UPI001B1029F1|nr:alpha/beta hydrolase-fold protein [Chitinophaga sp.]MBO9727092.1 hypothetical protein [Chitinophaga sp.]